MQLTTGINRLNNGLGLLLVPKPLVQQLQIMWQKKFKREVLNEPCYLPATLKSSDVPPTTNS